MGARREMSRCTPGRWRPSLRLVVDEVVARHRAGRGLGLRASRSECYYSEKIGW